MTDHSVPAVIEMVDVELGSYFMAPVSEPKLTNPEEVQEAIRGLKVSKAPGPVWTGVKNLATIRIRFPDCSARSESLYRLRYPGPQKDSNVEFYENPSSGSSVVSGRTDVTKLIVLRTRLKFPE